MTRSVAARRAALSFAASVALVGMTTAAAQSYPVRSLRLVVGFAPGGAADFVARALAEPMSRALGQQVVVDNRPGAGSSIAADIVSKAPADGYTMLIASPSSISVNPIINKALTYNVKRDLVPITRVSSSPLVVAVNPGTGIHSVRELIDAAKKAPGKLNFATSGNGSAPHLATVLFTSVAGIDMVHVPFKGGAPAVQSVLAGETQVTFATPPSVLPQVQGNRLRALAITSRVRSPLMPNIPGMEEAGLSGYEISFWYGFFVPTGTDRTIVQRIFDVTTAVLQDPKVKEMLARDGTETAASKSPQDFVAFLEEDDRLWARLVKASGAKTD
jgi:tripartite-type tricarboxylate transporter receptor subunit TctC